MNSPLNKTTSNEPVASVLPAHWGIAQRIKNTLLYHLIRFLYSLISLIPFTIARQIGVFLGHLAFWIAPGERKNALLHLSQAFPDTSPEERKTTVQKMFVHLGEAVAEITHLDSVIKHPDLQLTPEQRDLIIECLNENKGGIAVTGHLGNWELLAHVLAAHSFPVNTIAKPVYDPRLTHWVDRIRSRFGLRVIWRGQQSGIKEMIRVFHSKEILALLMNW